MTEYLPNITNDQLKWIAVDLDLTLCEGVWPDPGIGKILPGAKEALDSLVAKGYKIVIYTARAWNNYESIERWCLDNGLTIRRIICGKPLAKYVIDDRNIEFKGDWQEVLNKINSNDEIKIN